MLTAMLTVENILTGTSHDVWRVNVEEDYHEQRDSGSGRSGDSRVGGVSGSGGIGDHGTGRAAPIVPAG
jgi:hypothetical protein